MWVAAAVGDGAAFGELFDRHKDRVFRHAYRLLRNVPDAEDASATAFLELWRRRRHVRVVDGSILPWLLVTTTYVSRNLQRSASRYRAVIDALPRDSAESDTAARYLDEHPLDAVDPRFTAALRRLSVADMELFMLVAFEDFPLSRGRRGNQDERGRGEDTPASHQETTEVRTRRRRLPNARDNSRSSGHGTRRNGSMNAPTMPEQFSTALRAALLDRIDHELAPAARKRHRLWVGIGVLSGVGLLAGAGAATAAFLGLPGSTQVIPLADAVLQTHTGTATIQLGAAPDGATNVSLTLTCESAGSFAFPDGATLTCSTTDLTNDEKYRSAGYSIPLNPGDSSVTITTSPDATWTVTAAYTNETVTDLAENANGDTYGVQGGGAQEPDLIAVVATNGREGYVYKDELAAIDGTNEDFASPEEALAWQKEREGKTFSIHVYLPDGETIIGQFDITG